MYILEVIIIFSLMCLIAMSILIKNYANTLKELKSLNKIVLLHVLTEIELRCLEREDYLGAQNALNLRKQVENE